MRSSGPHLPVVCASLIGVGRVDRRRVEEGRGQPFEQAERARGLELPGLSPQDEVSSLRGSVGDLVEDPALAVAGPGFQTDQGPSPLPRFGEQGVELAQLGRSPDQTRLGRARPNVVHPHDERWVCLAESQTPLGLEEIVEGPDRGGVALARVGRRRRSRISSMTRGTAMPSRPDAGRRGDQQRSEQRAGVFGRVQRRTR